MIAPRTRTGALGTLTLALLFGALFATCAVADRLLSSLPAASTAASGAATLRLAFLVHIAGFVLIVVLYSRALCDQGGEQAHFRTQCVLLATMTLIVTAGKATLLFSRWSLLWAPLLLLVVPTARLVGRRAASATVVAAACCLWMLQPGEIALLPLLIAQGLTAAWVVRTSGFGVIAAGAASSLVSLASLSVVTIAFDSGAANGLWPIRLPTTMQAALISPPVAAVVGPLLWAMLAVLATPAFRRMLGHLSRAQLIALADFDHPLLRRIAEGASGTWSHSLNVANLAEMAANRIHADALLVRVAAYFHDAGKTVHPQYYIENQQGKNPHDRMDPEQSADAIISHVVEGGRLANKCRLPRPIAEFIYSHHGDTVLEYFWHKAQSMGNPRGSRAEDFRYPGFRPPTREQGILAIVDAVEAASKTLREPDLKQLQGLVRQIMFDKLSQGMLDESGLSVAELRLISASLVDSLKSSLHVRVKYPWQESGRSGKKRRTTEPPASPRAGGAKQVARRKSPTAGSAIVPPAPDAEEDPAWALSAGSRTRRRPTTRPLGADEVPSTPRRSE